MFRIILASITMFSIVFFSVGQIAFALPQVDSAEKTANKTESCPTCLTGAPNPLDRLATLGRQTQNIELLPITRSQVKGSPMEYVSSSSGEIAFAQTDLIFKDNPLLVFQRTYLSSRAEDIGLGRGWSFAFNDSIALDNNTAILTSSTGDNFSYLRIEAKRYVLQPSDSTDVKEFNVENGNTISAKNGDVTKVYKRMGNDYYLSQITAPGGFEVIINRNGNGKIRSITSINGEINLNWSSGNNPKLLAVSDNTGRRVSFGQANGSLQNATTATGGKWQYEYAGGKISNVINPANRTALRAKYDANGRAAEVGDAAGLNRLTYEINQNNVSTRTTFTDSLGYARVFQHNERGILTGVSDAMGTLLSIQNNEADQPVRLTDASGATTIFEYDAKKRLMRQQMPDSSEKDFEYAADGKLTATTENGERTEIVYDGNGNLAGSRIQKRGKNIRNIFNRNGQKIREQSDDKTAAFEYDDKGRPTAIVSSDAGRFERIYDSVGRTTMKKMPSGFVHNYGYNADNQIIRQSDNRGRSARVERDASGNITKIINQNTEVEVLRDEAGRITQLTNSLGQSRRYVYNSRGSLIRFIGADGRDLRFQYNERGEMQSIFNAETDALIYQRNGRGNLAKIQRSTSRKNLWQMQKISFASSFNKATEDESCAFRDSFDMSGGGDSGWMDSWGGSGSIFMSGTEVSGDGAGATCNDPFAGAGGDKCYNSSNCFDKALDCLLAVGAVVATFISLATCAETLGATCILALIIQPVAGASTGLKCSSAITECEKPNCPKG